MIDNYYVNFMRHVSEKFNINIFLVGGAIRDRIMGIDASDFDFVAETSIENHFIISKYLAQSFNCELKYNDYYKTSKFVIGEIEIDFIMARSEFYPLPASKPIINPSNIYKDIARRDFTINTIAYNLSKNELIDLYQGKKDIYSGIIRILHSESFKDDPIRIFRAIKYSSRFNFNYESFTKEQINLALKSGFLKLIPFQRIKKELLDILNEKNLQYVIKQIDEFNILENIFQTTIKINLEIYLEYFYKLDEREKLVCLLYKNDLETIKLIENKFDLGRTFTETCILTSEIKNKLHSNDKIGLYTMLLENENKLNKNLLFAVFKDELINNFFSINETVKVDKNKLLNIEETNRKKYIVEYKLGKLLELGGNDDV